MAARLGLNAVGLFIHSFIHSGYFYSASQFLYYSEALPTQHAYCVGVSHRSATPQATASEGLAQGLYVAARAGFEPATLRTKGVESTNAPPRPMSTCLVNVWYLCIYIAFLKVNNDRAYSARHPRK